jgi:hypothetical protein
MKTILLTIATMSCISLTAQVTEPIKAQEGSVTIDTLRQTITVDNGGDTTRIKLRKKTIIIIEDDDDEDDEKGDRNGEGHWAGFGGSANFFVTDNFDVANKEDALFLEIDFSRSASLNMNIYEKRFPIIKEYVGLTTGLGFQFSFYELKNNVDITVNSDSTFGTINLTNDFSTNRLQLFYLQVPLLLEFNTSKNLDKNWHLSFGVTGAFKMGASYLKKWKNDGEKYKDKMRSSFNMHPFQAYGTAIVGYGNYSVFIHYGLTSLFEKDKGPNFAPVSAGILVNF